MWVHVLQDPRFFIYESKQPMEFNIYVRHALPYIRGELQLHHELRRYMSHLAMCPDTVVFKSDAECEIFAYYFKNAIICKLLYSNRYHLFITNELTSPFQLMAHFSTPPMHNFSTIIYELAFIHKHKQLHMGRAIRMLDTSRPRSIADAFNIATAWAEAPLHKAAMDISTRRLIASAFFEHAQERTHGPNRSSVSGGSDYITSPFEDDFCKGAVCE